MRQIIMILLMMPVLAAGVYGGDLVIRGGNYGNWYVRGEVVQFKIVSGAADGPVTVRLYNSDNREIHSSTLSGDRLRSEGWQFTPAEPGFYEVEFWIGDQPVSESWNVVINKQDPADKRKYTKVADRDFFVSRHAFVVAPAPTRPVAEISPYFGVSPHFSMYKNEVRLGRLVGFKNIRIHAIEWDELEKEKGKIDWSKVDDFMNTARQNGYSDDNIIFNILGVPQWASSRPEADWINICMREYATVLPRDLGDWTNFLKQVMARYPGVKTYELWNEPHLIGYSCFWADSVENFVILLKSGYQTIKTGKPESTVWMGGIALRYLPFYDQFLRLGGGDSYDVLPLHGSWQDPRPFHALEKKYHVADKPVVSSEWHAMLLKPYQAVLPSEKILARNMLLDFLRMIRLGVTEADFFCVLNLYRIEKETLEFYRQHNSYDVHVSGLFRQMPYIQPRLPALAWHNWISWVNGRLKIADGYLFDDNQQRVLQFADDKGQMLLVWNNSDTPRPVSSKIIAAVGPQTTGLDMEGRPVRLRSGFVLEPENYYVIFNPELAAVSAWGDSRGEVLALSGAKNPLRHDYQGTYRDGKLFDERLELIDPAALRYFPINDKIVVDDAASSANVVGRFAAGVTPEYLDLVVEATDARHVNTATDMRQWEFDSVQFALDTTGEGYENRRVEFAAGRHDNGKATLWKVTAPGLDGDLPGQYSPAAEQVRYAKLDISRQGEKTVYKIRINASELYPLHLSSSPALRFAVLINNNDGHGRAAYVQWGAGIGGAKNPGEYGDLTPVAREKKLPGQQDLIYKGWNQRDYELQISDGQVRVIGNSPQCSGVATGNFAVTSGAGYCVSFEARGRARMQCVVYDSSQKRTDLLPATALTAEWQKFELRFNAPAGAVSANVSLFAWQQPGCEFDIRNFNIQPR